MNDSPHPLLRIQGVTKSYREGERRRAVLHGVDLEIERGQITAILGESGSGKSTLLNVIGGIDVADAGEVWVDGTNLTRLDEESRTLFRRRHIGIVFQFFNLIDTLTVAENVALPLELCGVAPARASESVADLVDKVGLGDRLDSFPDQLSGGEQQRIALARALVHEPTLILADEPTGNLDEHTGDAILELLAQLTRQRHANLVLVTHSSKAASIADRVLVMRDGELTQGSAER